MLLRALLVIALIASCKKSHQSIEPLAGSAASQPGSATDPQPKTDPQITEFWKWFQGNAKSLHDDKDLQHTMETISDKLDQIQPGLIGEIGVSGEKHDLVITADGKKELFPRVQEVYAARPTVEGWNIIAFRPRMKPGEKPFTIEMGKTKIDPTTVKYVSQPDGKKLDIQVYIPGYTTDEEMGQVGFLILDHTVGEYDMETKIQGIDFAALTKAPATA